MKWLLILQAVLLRELRRFLQQRSRFFGARAFSARWCGR